jgi:hypothetical protein
MTLRHCSKPEKSTTDCDLLNLTRLLPTQGDNMPVLKPVLWLVVMAKNTDSDGEVSAISPTTG